MKLQTRGATFQDIRFGLLKTSKNMHSFSMKPSDFSPQYTRGSSPPAPVQDTKETGQVAFYLKGWAVGEAEVGVLY